MQRRWFRRWVHSVLASDSLTVECNMEHEHEIVDSDTMIHSQLGVQPQLAQRLTLPGTAQKDGVC